MTSTFSTAVVLRSEQSGGALSVTDNTLPARWDGPPLHHHAFDEAFYVLDGELTFEVDGELLTARADELAFAPGGCAHTFTNRGARDARFLVIITPAGFEREFARRAARKEGADPPGWAMGELPEVTRLGPPIGDRHPS
jgi:mannose-6-phosphate isomerase-like protein (cupin superfamily)